MKFNNAVIVLTSDFYIFLMTTKNFLEYLSNISIITGIYKIAVRWKYWQKKSNLRRPLGSIPSGRG